MNSGARLNGCARKPPDIGKRLDRRRPAIEQGTGIGGRPRGLGRGFGIQPLDRRAKRLPLGGAHFQLGLPLGAIAAMQRALMHEFAVDIAAPHDRSHIRRAIRQQVQQTPPVGFAQGRDQIIRQHPHPRIDEACIATRRTETDLLGFEDDDRGIALGQMQGGRAAGEASPDDHHLCLGGPGKRGRVRSQRSCLFPQTVAARIT